VEGSCELVVSGGDAPQVLDAAEGVFHEMAVAVSGLVVDGFALSVDAAQDDRDFSLLAQAFPDHGGVIALIGDEVARAGRAVKQQACSHHIRHMARRQLEDVGAARACRSGRGPWLPGRRERGEYLVLKSLFCQGAGRFALT
jgi:hypothetical protein